MFHFTQEPYGAYPMQAHGEITATGQALYFHYRGGKASLYIFKDGEFHVADRDCIVRSFEIVIRWSETLPVRIVKALISEWVEQYLGEVTALCEKVKESRGLSDAEKWERLVGDD